MGHWALSGSLAPFFSSPVVLKFQSQLLHPCCRCQVLGMLKNLVTLWVTSLTCSPWPYVGPNTKSTGGNDRCALRLRFRHTTTALVPLVADLGTRYPSCCGSRKYHCAWIGPRCSSPSFSSCQVGWQVHCYLVPHRSTCAFPWADGSRDRGSLCQP